MRSERWIIDLLFTVQVKVSVKVNFAGVIYPNHLKRRVSVGIKSDLGKALIASNSGSIAKINNAV